jgi:hypothetical protein
VTSRDRWLRVRDLFERALDEEPAAIDGWLEREADDRQLADEVRSLVAHHSRAGSFLVEPVADLTDLFAEGRSLEPGQVLGPYTVEREIGRGGMGRVYLARDTRLGRIVALKAPSPELTADPAHRDRLRREARAAAALAHPGICTIYALEELEGELFIATEYVEGETLRTAIDSGQRPDGDSVFATARELAAALAHAHNRGVTHRDLKPENVMRRPDGHLKILDFGLALMESSGTGLDPRVTQRGAIAGTPAYLAPEQINGDAGDPRADIFAYGVLLYEYACGTHPFAAATPLATLARILDSDATPIAERCPQLPGVIVEVIERCLQKEPANRFASAADVLRALDRSALVGRARPMARWWRAHQLIVIALYFVACLTAWQIKEWNPGPAVTLFVIAGIAATVGGVFRGHLLFTERLNRSSFALERRKAVPVTLATDLVLAISLAVDGAVIAPLQPLTGVLTIALAVGLALARLLVEPATTAAAFKQFAA